MPILVNAYSTVLPQVAMKFPHTLHSHRDQTDAELENHLDGFIGYALSRGSEEMSFTKYHVMRHIERVRNHYSFSVAEADHAAYFDWARASNSILFLDDATIRDPVGKILISPDDGLGDDDARVPYPADALARKATNLKQLVARHALTSPSLPPVLGEQECAPRSATEVAQRALGIFLTAVCAEARASGEPIPIEELQSIRPLSHKFTSPEERDYIANSESSEQDNINFAWRYEACNLLLWALGKIEELPFPDAICDVPAIAELIFGADEAEFIAGATLRPTAEVLDQLDLHYQLHWAAVELRVNRGRRAEEFDEGVIRERHHALNWLTGFQNVGVEWDEIQTPT